MSDIKIREIVEEDIEKGFLKSLDSLRKASDLEKEVAKDILKKIISDPNHIIHVAEDNGKIVGSTTLLIEQKFIHKGGYVGHIEDVVVSKEFEGRGVPTITLYGRVIEHMDIDEEEFQTILSRLVGGTRNSDGSQSYG